MSSGSKRFDHQDQVDLKSEMKEMSHLQDKAIKERKSFLAKTERSDAEWKSLLLRKLYRILALIVKLDEIPNIKLRLQEFTQDIPLTESDRIFEEIKESYSDAAAKDAAKVMHESTAAEQSRLDNKLALLDKKLQTIKKSLDENTSEQDISGREQHQYNLLKAELDKLISNHIELKDLHNKFVAITESKDRLDIDKLVFIGRLQKGLDWFNLPEVFLGTYPKQFNESVLKSVRKNAHENLVYIADKLIITELAQCKSDEKITPLLASITTLLSKNKDLKEALGKLSAIINEQIVFTTSQNREHAFLKSRSAHSHVKKKLLIAGDGKEQKREKNSHHEPRTRHPEPSALSRAGLSSLEERRPIKAPSVANSRIPHSLSSEQSPVEKKSDTHRKSHSPRRR